MSDYIIGLTGGVAAGKSAVEACFRALGVAVADADAAARPAGRGAQLPRRRHAPRSSRRATIEDVIGSREDGSR